MACATLTISGELDAILRSDTDKGKKNLLLSLPQTPTLTDILNDFRLIMDESDPKHSKNREIIINYILADFSAVLPLHLLSPTELQQYTTISCSLSKSLRSLPFVPYTASNISCSSSTDNPPTSHILSHPSSQIASEQDCFHHLSTTPDVQHPRTSSEHFPLPPTSLADVYGASHFLRYISYYRKILNSGAPPLHPCMPEFLYILRCLARLLHERRDVYFSSSWFPVSKEITQK